MTAILIRPRRFGDQRGWFTESYNRVRESAAGIDVDFCQDNHSLSVAPWTLRGIHFQRMPHAQAKLVRCVRGRIWDVAIDLRRQSPTWLHHVAVELSAENGHALFVPAGYGHGFVTLEPDCEVIYKVDAYYAPAADAGIRWDDPALGIAWPEAMQAPMLSDKDAALPLLADAAPDFPYDGKPLRPLDVPDGHP